MRPAISEDSMRLIEGRTLEQEIPAKAVRHVPKIDPGVYARISERQRKSRAKK